MAKGDVLTAEEMASYRPYPEILRYIFHDTSAGNSPGTPRRVLDWGCGRGRLVLALLRRGVDCYGVDSDPRVIANAEALFAAEGHDPGERLRSLGADQRTAFPDGHFDIVVSDNVLEHVADLDGVLAEMARITRPGGWGFHLFPARFTIMEGHLRMPFVHWLPKTGLRRAAIGLFVALGIEPRWPETRGLPAREKADLYFRYSRDKTFYRPPRRILAACRQHGLTARLVAHNHPRVRNNPVLGSLSRIAAPPLSHILSECKTMELLLERTP